MRDEHRGQQQELLSLLLFPLFSLSLSVYLLRQKRNIRNSDGGTARFSKAPVFLAPKAAIRGTSRPCPH